MNQTEIVEPNLALVVFTKYPKPGLAKTRLIPLLGEVGAANLQRSMTTATLKEVQKLTGSVDIYVYFTGAKLTEMRSMFGDFNYRPQAEGDLGNRMLSAFQDLCPQADRRVIIIGCDCPDLNSSLIQSGFDRLQEKDLVLGRAADGGYYLIGLKRPIPALFRGISWSTDRVLSQTVNIATTLGLSIDYLPILRDIDRPEDLDNC
jgi:rSAM/selenodomain-associated transferase 1